MKKFKGITLVEVAVIVGIIVTVVAVASNVYNDVSTAKENRTKYNHGTHLDCDGGKWQAVQVSGDGTILYRCERCGETIVSYEILK